MSGTAKLIVYLLNVDDNKALEEIADKIAGILVVPEEDDNCRGIIAAEVWDAPEDEAELVREIGKDASWLIIPGTEITPIWRWQRRKKHEGDHSKNYYGIP